MNTSTLIVDLSILSRDTVIANCIIVVNGVAVVLLDTPLFLTIAFSKSLRTRREMLLIAVLSFYENCWVGSLMTMAATALSFQYSKEMVTPLNCMSFHYNSIAAFMASATMCANLATTVDRLISVANLSLYLSLGRKYTATVISVPVGISSIILLLAWIGTTKMPNSISVPLAKCSLSTATASQFNVNGPAVVLPVSILVTGIYGVIYILVKQQRSQVVFSGLLQIKRQREIKILKLAALLCIVLAVGQIMPTLASIALQYFLTKYYLAFLPYILMTKTSYVVAYVFILWYRQREIRSEFLKLLKPAWRKVMCSQNKVAAEKFKGLLNLTLRKSHGKTSQQHNPANDTTL